MQRTIEARRAALSDKRGGDSVFTLFLALDIDPGCFSRLASAHFFYTPSATGLSTVNLRELSAGSPAQGGYTRDKACIVSWTRRYLEMTTYEVSCPALRDASLAPAGKTGLIVSTLMEHSLFAHAREMGWDEEYQRLCRECIIDVLTAGIFPRLRGSLIDAFSSTPRSRSRFSRRSPASTRQGSGRSAPRDCRQGTQGPRLTGVGASPVNARLRSQARRPSSLSRAWAAGFSLIVRWKNRPLAPASSGAAAM